MPETNSVSGFFMPQRLHKTTQNYKKLHKTTQNFAQFFLLLYFCPTSDERQAAKLPEQKNANRKLSDGWQNTRRQDHRQVGQEPTQSSAKRTGQGHKSTGTAKGGSTSSAVR